MSADVVSHLVRPRDPALIRRDAIQMALARAGAGCIDCARGYFQLARAHGASDAELRDAIRASKTPRGITRREVVKLALATGATVSASALFAQPALAGTVWWGTDSGGATCCGIPQNFYIGEFGYGLTRNTVYFNTTAASNAGKYNSYEYWGLVGPDARPGGYTPYSWGQAQGQKAVNEWFQSPDASYVFGHTIFGDVEPGFGGWGSSQTNNQACLNGYLDYVSTAGYNLNAGVYVSPLNWTNYFGTAFVPTQTFVLWLTGCRTCGFTPRPCDDGAGAMSQAHAIWDQVGTGPGSVILGSRYAVVWQYWISDCGCTDFNLCNENPYNKFLPLTGSQTYYGCV